MNDRQPSDRKAPHLPKINWFCFCAECGEAIDPGEGHIVGGCPVCDKCIAELEEEADEMCPEGQP